MTKDQEEELRRIQEMAVTHAIEEMDESNKLGLASKDDRGDRYWYAKMATQSLQVAARIEAFIMLKHREGLGAGAEDDETETRKIDKMVLAARNDVKTLLDRAKSTAKKASRNKA